jgi:hypothetical protein
MQHLNFLNFDLGTVVPLGCMFEVNHISSLYSMTILSIVIMVGMYYRSHQLKIRNGKRKLLEGETDWSALLFNYLLIFTFLIFPTVSTKVSDVAKSFTQRSAEQKLTSPQITSPP